MLPKEDIETLLDILGNRTRRRIVMILSQEPKYLYQLAKEFRREFRVTQQAILKQLQHLKERGLIESFQRPSDKNAPPRRYYRLKDSVHLSIALGDNASRFSGVKVGPREFEVARLLDLIDQASTSLQELEGASPSKLLPERPADILSQVDEAMEEIQKIEAHLLWLRQCMLQRLREERGGPLQQSGT